MKCLGFKFSLLHVDCGAAGSVEWWRDEVCRVCEISVESGSPLLALRSRVKSVVEILLGTLESASADSRVAVFGEGNST